MNQIVTIPQESHGLVPSSMGEAMKLAEMMAGAKLVPQALQKSPADCLMVIQQAVRWQMDPFAVAQECSVIQGKLMHSGKLVAAVVNARGNLANRLSFSYEGEGDARTITVTGRLQNEAEARTVEVKLGNAKTNNRVWLTQPDQQLMYHGVRVWARRHTPELMLGVYSPEEFDEQPSTPAKKPARPAPLTLAKPEPHDPETGEIVESDHAQEDSLQPPQPSPTPQAAADEPAPPSTPVPRSSTDGAGDIPTADAYVARWNTIVEQATSAKQLHEAWAADKATRNLIDWPDDDTFDKLKKHVTNGINFIKKVPA